MTLNKWLFYTIIAGLFVLPVAPLIVSSSFLFPFITGKAFFFRLITSVIFAAWLLLALREPDYRPRRTPINYALGAFGVVVILATIFSVDPLKSFWSNFERMDGLLSYLHLIAFYFVISSTLKSSKIWRYLLQTSVAVSVVISGWGLVQLAGWATINQGGVRLDATLGNATYLAVYLLIHLFIVSWLWITKPAKAKWQNYLYGAIVLLELFILYHTATRGAILGLLVGAVLAALIVAWRSTGKTRRLALTPIIAVIVLAVGFLAIKNTSLVQNSPVLSRFANISWTETTTQSRLIIWQMSLQGFKEHPILGWGPENYNLVFNKYYNPALFRNEPWFDRSHDVFFDWLINAGLLGLLSYLAIFGTAFWALWRELKNKNNLALASIFAGFLVAYFIHNVFVFDNLISYLGFFTLLAFINYTAWPNAKPLIDDRFKLNSSSTTTVASGLVLIGLVVGTYYFDFRPMGEASLIIKALSPIEGNYTPDQVAEQRLAMFDQASSYTYLGRGEAREQFLQAAFQAYSDSNLSTQSRQNFVNAAIRQMQQQVADTPLDARPPFFLGNFLNAFGAYKEALPFLEQAAKLSPAKNSILFELGTAYIKTGQVDKGLKILADVSAAAPDYNEARNVYAAALVGLGRLAEAKAILVKAYGTDVVDDNHLLNAYVQAGLNDKVLGIWELKVKADPTNADNYLSLAAAYLNIGRRDLAITQIEQAIKVNPSIKAKGEYFINEIRAGRTPQ